MRTYLKGIARKLAKTRSCSGSVVHIVQIQGRESHVSLHIGFNIGLLAKQSCTCEYSRPVSGEGGRWAPSIELELIRKR